jgi:flagellar biosynthesis GTPase FlhF
MSKKLIREGLRKDLQMEPRPQMLQPGGFPAGTPLKLVGDIVKKIDLTGVGPGEKIPGGGRLATAAEQEEAADAAADAAAEQEEEQEAREAKRLAAEDAARVAAEAVVPEKTAAQIAEEEADVARRQRSAQRKPITTKIIT